MKISEKDQVNLNRIVSIVSRIDNNDFSYFNTTTDEINKYQPFLLSMLLGYKIDLTLEEFEEISKIIVLIWELFKENSSIRKTKLTEQQFEKFYKRNIDLMKYLDGEQNEQEICSVTISDLNHLKSKSLLTAIFYRFKNQQPLMAMPWKMKGIVLIGIKSLVESLEEIVNLKNVRPIIE